MNKIIFAILWLSLGILSVLGQNEGVMKNYAGVNWSPDGKTLSFSIIEMSMGPPRRMKAALYVMKADGTGVRRITDETVNAFGGSWSKDGKRLYFQAVNLEKKEREIYAINADGTGLTQLTKTGRAGAPIVSPDGKRIVFNSETIDRKPQISVMNIDGTGIKALTNDNTIAFYDPVWSPDGKQIVYYTEKGDNKDQIWVMNADGSNQRLLTNNVGHNFYPSWSADGKRIIFTSDRDGEKEVIYSMKTDGTDIRRLMKTNSAYAKISPDGKRVVFISGKFPKTGISVVNLDGTNEVSLAQ